MVPFLAKASKDLYLLTYHILLLHYITVNIYMLYHHHSFPDDDHSLVEISKLSKCSVVLVI